MESKWTCYFNKEVCVGGPWFGWKQTGLRAEESCLSRNNDISLSKPETNLLC